jgi:hypothetical protein
MPLVSDQPLRIDAFLLSASRSVRMAAKPLSEDLGDECIVDGRNRSWSGATPQRVDVDLIDAFDRLGLLSNIQDGPILLARIALGMPCNAIARMYLRGWRPSPKLGASALTKK